MNPSTLSKFLVVSMCSTFVSNISLAATPAATVDASKDYYCQAPIFAYKTKAPSGWKLDTESGKANNLCIVGYPEKESWSTKGPLMYFSASAKGKEKGSQNLTEIIARDLAYHKKSNPQLSVKEADTLTAGDKKVQVKHFVQDPQKGRYEAVGYIDEPKAVVMAVLSAPDKASFDQSLPAFNSLVENYQTVSSKKTK